MSWELRDALRVCEIVEGECMANGTCHVALTGGVLYKSGARKDLDLLFYKVRQKTKIDRVDLLKRLNERGFKIEKRCGWCFKALWRDKNVDLFFPESDEEWDVDAKTSAY